MAIFTRYVHLLLLAVQAIGLFFLLSPSVSFAQDPDLPLRLLVYAESRSGSHATDTGYCQSQTLPSGTYIAQEHRCENGGKRGGVVGCTPLNPNGVGAQPGVIFATEMPAGQVSLAKQYSSSYEFSHIGPGAPQAAVCYWSLIPPDCTAHQHGDQATLTVNMPFSGICVDNCQANTTPIAKVNGSLGSNDKSLTYLVEFFSSSGSGVADTCQSPDLTGVEGLELDLEIFHPESDEKQREELTTDNIDPYHKKQDERGCINFPEGTTFCDVSNPENQNIDTDCTASFVSGGTTYCNAPGYLPPDHEPEPEFICNEMGGWNGSQFCQPDHPNYKMNPNSGGEYFCNYEGGHDGESFCQKGTSFYKCVNPTQGDPCDGEGGGDGEGQGDGDGDGDGGVSAGHGSCSKTMRTPPSCKNADPVMCAILVQDFNKICDDKQEKWDREKELEGLSKQGESIIAGADATMNAWFDGGESEGNSFGDQFVDALDSSGSGFGGSGATCPPPYQISLPFGSFSLPLQFICDWAVKIRPFVIFLGWLSAFYIGMRSLGGA